MSFLGEFDERTWCVRREIGVKYFSTRGAGPVILDEALRKGIASDGGLFLPEQLPTFNVSDFAAADSIPEVAAVLLSPFFDGSALEGEIVWQ